ncbi:hypothetical protein GYMLUDRAFT_49406 [Collybiopsis luxurians FD-317 M1]|uniref:Uncharacterized protein n=1 Tax=Collybiopsis luxurians FD-317 M1 TaxID=944289 RepID=A0A0D0ASL5_9AGAR|nr:hypothetical protein GYMLUDRAFT_49406 [Collybiopsis luxurians FD-317 M1]
MERSRLKKQSLLLVQPPLRSAIASDLSDQSCQSSRCRPMPLYVPPRVLCQGGPVTSGSISARRTAQGPATPRRYSADISSSSSSSTATIVTAHHMVVVVVVVRTSLALP